MQFLVSVDDTIAALLRSEDVDGDVRITADDNGPKVTLCYFIPPYYIKYLTLLDQVFSFGYSVL